MPQNSVSTSLGFDAPITIQGLDRLDRTAFARNIYRVVCDAPQEWSLRAAVCGRWGEGKTSVLRLVREMAHEDGHVCVWLDAWDAVGARLLWQRLAEALIQEFERLEIKVDKTLKDKALKARVYTAALWDRFFRPGAAAAAEAHPYAKAVFGGLDVLRSTLDVRSRHLQELRRKVQDRRIVIFLDDLDRADPHVAPQLLLSLREILDVPQLSFVLALDFDVVSSALAAYHPGFKSESDFLAKIIDFPFEVPAVTAHQRDKLLNQEASKYCSFIPAS